MATTQPNTDDPSVASRDDHLDRFVTVANAIEPEHSYADPWPITPDNVDFGYCQHNARYWAKCGPRNGVGGTYVSYKIDTRSFNSWSAERQLAVITHELVHLSIGHNYDVAVHPPAFWNRMAFDAQRVLDAFLEIQDAWVMDLDIDEYKDQVISDPNGSTVDHRYESVDDVQARMEQWVRDYTPDFRN